ncbi:MAG: PEP-CTERM sorting domain-containing protein [Verrucomicrobiales bacterium]|jgi:hypothetical protein|nr:PEP-CTERM sorting domain-containing protein [Verrucomicrobiales bacterium]
MNNKIFGNSAIRQFGNSLSRSLTLACALFFSLSAALTVSADTYEWNGGTSGTWNVTNVENWLVGESSPTYAPGISGTTGDADVVISSGSVTIDILSFQVNTLTVGENATFIVPSGNRSGFTTGLTNNGLMRYIGPGFRNLAISTSQVASFQMTNSGTVSIEAGNLQFSVNLINTDTGLVEVLSGVTLDLRGASGFTNGVLRIDSGAKVWAENVGGTVILANVVTDNAGYWEWFSNGMNDRNRTLTVSGGVFTNSGTLILRQDTSATNFTRSPLDLNVNNSGTFVNDGVIAIENTAAGSSGTFTPNGNISAQLTVANNAAEFTNNGLITIHNNATVDNTSNYTKQAALTVANGEIFTNTGTIIISLGADVTDDAQHYAALTVSTDWTNNGTIIIAGANKTTAKASLDLGDHHYTAGAGSVTVLVNDAQLKAAAVTISGGTFDGAGKILAATTVSGGGVLDPDGTLTLSSLTLDDGGILNFSIADNDLLDITGDLTLSGATLNLTDSALTEGAHLLANYGGILTGDALTVSGLADYNYALDFATDKQIFLNITSIPEPAAWALLLAGAALLAARRRRR